MSGTTYDLNLKLAPFLSASMDRTGADTAIINIDLDPAHAKLTVRLLSMGTDQQFIEDGTTTPTIAQVFSLVNDYDAAALTSSTDTKRSFPIVLDSDPSVKDVGIVGMDPDTVDANGDLLDNGDGGLTPISVVVRKKRIPIPQAAGQSSMMANAVKIAGSFVAGVLAAKLTS